MEFQTRTDALRAVREALPVFRNVSDLCNAAICTRQQYYRQRTIRAARADERGRVIGGILGLLAADVVVLPAFMLSKAAHAGKDSSLLTFLFIAVGFAIWFLTAQLVRKRFRARGEAERPEDQTLTARLENISNSLVSITQQNQTLIDAMPRDYQNYEAVCFFEQALANGRADSMQEAINLYEEQLHRMTMEQNSRRAVQEQYLQSQMIADIQKSSRAAAINSGIAATFSVLTFLNRD